MKFHEKFTLFYPNLLNFITEFTNVIFSLLKTLFNTIFIPVILIGVIIVEIPRVQSGIQVFDPDPNHAFVGAGVLVFLLLVLEFLALYLEQKHDFQQANEYQFSFRLLFDRIRYLFGLYKDFVPREKSPAIRYKSIAKLIRYGIIFLSVIGTMQFAIEKASSTNLPWHIAITEVFINSDLQTITDWLVGLVFALMIVFSSTALTNYIGIVAFDAQKEILARQNVFIKKQQERLKPELFFDEFRSSILKSLVYLQGDYFTKHENKVRFYDAARDKITKEFILPEERQKFIQAVERTIKERS